MNPYCKYENVYCYHLVTRTCPRFWTDHPSSYPECQSQGNSIRNEQKENQPLTSVRCPKCLRLTIFRKPDLDGELTLGFCKNCKWEGKLINTVKI